jgi:arsenate reductase-like glutaredoxin family protein
VVEHLQKTFDGADDVGLACVYFNYKESIPTAAIIPNILKQVLERSPTISQETMDLYAQFHDKRETRSSLKEILQLLNKEMSRISSLFVVLDALDECTMEANTRAKIILELQKIPNVRLLITGRRDVEDFVLSKFKNSAAILSIQASPEDIHKAIETQVGEILDLSKTPHSILSLVNKVVEKAKGMYSPSLSPPSNLR